MIERACEDLIAIRQTGGVLPRVAINVSAHQLACDDGLVDFVDSTLLAHGLTYNDLEFELTERQRLDNEGKGVSQLEALAARGARVTIDDFGIGYSSVAYLTELPIRAVKIDRAMVSRLPDHARTLRIIRHLVSLSRDLGLDVVAEGIETDIQNDLLRSAGCTLSQGYLRSRPLPASVLAERLWDANIR